MSELAYVLLTHCRRLGKLGYPVDGDAWLFPSRAGKLKAPSSLVTAIRQSAKDAELEKRITPHMMRYLFNDVLRLAGIDQVTRKALTGHVTDETTEHYSRVRLDEKRAAMEAAQIGDVPNRIGVVVPLVVGYGAREFAVALVRFMVGLGEDGERERRERRQR